MNTNRSVPRFNRRRFLRSAAVGGAGLAWAPRILRATAEASQPEPIHVALLGAGAQGSLLMTACLRIPGVRFTAACDIWEAYNLGRVSRILERYGHPVKAYTSHEEMLDRETDLDAVLVATPDCWHARHTIASLNAGLHVYCETPMAHTVEGARNMVEAARKTNKLLQIGHQRRSNPRYVFCYEKVLKEMKLLGQVTAVNGQWNRSAHPPLGWPKGREIDESLLQANGFESMHQFRNWRWYKDLGGGPVVDLGLHQIDVFNWFLDARPLSVQASGRMSHYDKEGYEWYNGVMAIYEYDTPQGPVGAYYQVLSTNSSFGCFETFLGDQGTLVISEVSRLGEAYREPQTDERLWAKWVDMGYLRAPKGLTRVELDLGLPMYIVGETPPPLLLKSPPYKLPVQMSKPYHQPHLENFFDAIRGNARLNCPADIGYETAVTVLRINEAITAGRKLEFAPGNFTA